LENTRISGHLQKGDIYISEKDLRFHDVTGDAIVAGGILEGKNIEASLGNHRCSRGKLTMGLKGANAPFHLNVWVKADAEHIPSLLKQKNLLRSKAVLRETDRLTGTRGSVLGRIILGDRLDSIHVAFEVTEMNLAIRYEPLPFPLVLTGGKVFFDERIVKITGVHGSIGNSSFSGLTARINLDDTAFVEIADGQLMVNTDEMYPWITSFRQIKPVFKDVRSMSGIIAAASLTMKGSLYQPKDWRFTVNGEARKLAIDATFLPGRAEETTGMFKITEDKFDLKDVRMRMIDSALDVSGTLTPFPADISSISLSLQGEIGPRVNAWISSFIRIPQELAVRAPFSLSDITLSWEKNRSTTFNGRLLFGKGIEVALKLTKTADELSVHEISVKNSDTDVTANVTLNKKAVDIVFKGILTSSTVNAILAHHMVSDASLRGDFRAHIVLKDPRQSVAEGVIEGTNFPIPWQYEVPLVMHDIAVNAQNKHIVVNTAHFSLGKENFMLKGSIDTTPAWFSVDMDLSADGIDWETLANIVRGTNDKEEGGKAGLLQDIPARGKVRIQSGFLRFRQFTLKPFHADISFDDERVHVRAKEAALCGISTTGDVHITSHGAEVAIGLSARNLELEPTLLCLSEKKVDMTGTFEIEADLKAKGKIDTIEKSVHGTFNFSAKDGKIVRSQPIEKTLDLVNETGNFKRKLSDLGKKIIDYRVLTMRGTIEEQRVVLEEGMLDASIFEILAQGEMHLREKTLDLNALVAPLSIGDRVVKKIPVLGHILGGNLVAVPVKIKGNLYDPQVTFLLPSAIGSAFLGIMERTIKLPIIIIEPVLPEKKQK
jgi:AsmA-like C-terminal region